MTLSSDISTTSTALSDIKTAIIAKGVTPSGNITTYAAAISNIPSGGGTGIPREVSQQGVYQMPASSFTFSLPSNATDVGSNGLYYAFYGCTGLTSLDLSSLTTVSGNYAFYYAFRDCTALTSVDLSALTTVSGSNGLQGAFYGCTSLTSVSFPSLATLSGGSAFSYAFSSCTGLTSVSFPSLTTVSGSSAFSYAFSSCTNIESISFPSLTTSSFGTTYKNQFNYMLVSTGSTKTHTLHFPSNLQSTISGLTGYPNFGGTSGYVTLSFDLPATS